MKFYQQLDSALESVSEPISYYSTLPDFASGEMPENIVIYTFYDNIGLDADNEPQEWEFTVTLTIFTPKRANIKLNKAIINAMRSKGFFYGGGGSSDFNEEFPTKAKYELEFNFTTPFETAESEG